MELSQESTISSDPSTKGFDRSAGTIWIYPTNYEFRDYQYAIARNALFGNTLVCLPTGLGKTLIAAVVMFNFWRWYPRGKIVFLAPTKPLVHQQMDACHDIMGLPTGDSIELTGTTCPAKRGESWRKKRVIFATPQVFQKDLENHIAPSNLVRCVVIDEAHKALGKHAYCESIRLLKEQTSCFRVLALSATPGSKIEDVCHVMNNLLISNLELRDENSPDIIPYLNKRQTDIIVVPLDADLARFKEKYVSIMDRWVRLLVQYNIIRGDASTITKGRIFYLYRDFQEKAKTNNRPSNYGIIMKTLTRCQSLYHAYDLLIRHGLRAFASFCQTHSADAWMVDEPDLQTLIDEVVEFLGPFPNVRPLPDGSVAEIPNDLVFGHTKYLKLKSLLVEHFNKFAAKNEDTRAIVFVEYRDSVDEVYVALLQLRPTIRPKIFVGQAGQKQKQQMQAMEAFRKNEANVLISTSVGEEGLDVGEVDLIICFDISQSSPIRLVQRMGRTGRKRDGRIIWLVTDGKEHQSLKSTMMKKNSMNKKILQSSNVISALYQESPRMVPPDLKPECSKRLLEREAPVARLMNSAAKGKRKRKENDEELQHGSKRKATTSKNQAVFPGNFEKSKAGQSSMLNFFKISTATDNSKTVSTQVSQPSQSKQLSTQISQSESVKLFTSDNLALEFLTLCAIKASKFDEERNKLDRMDTTYCATPPLDKSNCPFLYPVPDLRVLDCIAFLEEPMYFPSPQVSEDLDFHDEIDVADLQQRQVNMSENRVCNSPAIGSFNIEALFEDSSESSTTVYSDALENVTALENRKELPEANDNCKFQNKNDTKDVKQNHEFYAELFEDDFFDEPGVADALDNVSDAKEQESKREDLLNTGCFESILDESSDSDVPTSQAEPGVADALDNVSDAKEQESKREESLLNVGCFESILDESSDSDVPTSQGELDSKIKERVKRVSPPNQNKIDSFYSGNNKSLTNGQRATTPCANSKIVNKPVRIDDTFRCNDRKSSYLLNDTCQSAKVNVDTGSRSFAPGNKPRSSLNIGSHYKAQVYDTEVNSTDIVKTAINNSNQRVNRNFEEILSEDDDVIFVGEIDNSTTDIERLKERVENPVIEDEVIFEKESSAAENSRANKSGANSSTCTLTQILELIEKGTSSGLNLKKISKRSQASVNLNDSKLINASINAPWEKPGLLNNETAPKDGVTNIKNTSDGLRSIYFARENQVAKDKDVESKFEELLEDDLDLSDIKWEDDFEADKKQVDYTKATLREVEQTYSASERSKTDNQTSFLKKREEEFKASSDTPDNPSESNSKMAKALSPQKMMEFDLGDYEWDSDFEDPTNPIESLKRFSKPSNTSSPHKAKDGSASGSASKKLLSGTRKPEQVSLAKKILSAKNRKMFKPSTSRDFVDDDSDVEDDYFEKRKPGRDNNPNVNFALTTSRKNGISKESKSGKENIKPNSGFIDLSEFSANGKSRLPFPGRTAVHDRKKVKSLDRFPVKTKEGQKRNRIKSDFLDCEAIVSSDTSSGTSGEDDDLDGFVSHTQPAPDAIDMQGHYLQSIRDAYEPGAYHFKKPTKFVPDAEIYSQLDYQPENSTYIHDSFCVSGGDDDAFTETTEESFLESAERAMNKKKRKCVKNGRLSVAKRRKLAARSTDSSSSEDETEKLRKQIINESLDLKRNKK